jgi:hypothetical protein
MRVYAVWPLAALAGAAALGVTGHGPEPGELPRYLLTRREAFVLGPAQVIAPPAISRAEWSDDSQYVLAIRGDKPPLPIAAGPVSEPALVLWSRRTGRSQEFWKRPVGRERVDELGWLPQTHMALMIVKSAGPPAHRSATRQTLFEVDPLHRRVRRLLKLSGEKLLISPRQPLAALVDWSHERLRTLRADGSIGPPRRLWGAVPELFRWSPDGSALYWSRFGPRKSDEPVPPIQWLATDLQTGATKALLLGFQQPRGYQEKASPVLLRSDERSIPEAGPAQHISLLWLEGVAATTHPRLLISADSEGGALAPDASAVLYLSQGAAWVAPLTRLPREQMLDRVATIQRQLSLFRARQIAHALSLYAQDWDGSYPPMGETALDAIRPYLGSYEAMTPPGGSAPEFVYRYAGGPLKTLASPGRTEVGYVPGPGGRAVILADRHVEWRRDQRDRRSGAPERDHGWPDQAPAPSRSRFPARRTLPPPAPPPRAPTYPGGSP